MMQTIFINEGDVNSDAHSLLLRRKTMRGRERYFRKKGFWLLNAYIAYQIQPLLSFLPNIPVRKMQKIAKMEI